MCVCVYYIQPSFYEWNECEICFPVNVVSQCTQSFFGDKYKLSSCSSKLGKTSHSSL